MDNQLAIIADRIRTQIIQDCEANDVDVFQIKVKRYPIIGYFCYEISVRPEDSERSQALLSKYRHLNYAALLDYQPCRAFVFSYVKGQRPSVVFEPVKGVHETFVFAAT